MNDTFEQLKAHVGSVHELTSNAAKGAVNQMLTVRNWIIGYYIVEFEQHGEDRAKYGSHLLTNLSDSLQIKGLDRSMLNLCRIFYQKYPQIRDSVTHKLMSAIPEKTVLPGVITPALLSSIPTDDESICNSANHKFQTDPELLISRLSFTHIREIMSIDDPLERFFYEFECIHGTWSVRELKRQIGTNLYFRAGVSKKPELLLDKIQPSEPSAMLAVREPLALEFLGLDGRLAIEESDLEQALMNHLQEFLLEMGKGFCFEARQKRIIIDDEYYYPDLVLYNRILHCSVIVELKNEPFSHQHLGQLNAYVAYYKENEMHPGDNLPVGILLCTKKGPKMVEYALSGMDQQLFVSTYMLQLPNKEQLRAFLLKQMEEMGL